ERRAKRGRRSIDGKMRMIDAPEFLSARMHVHQFRLRLGDVEHTVALRRHFAEASTDEQHKICTFHPRQQFRIWANAEVSGVTAMRCVEQMPAPEGRDDRQGEALGKT